MEKKYDNWLESMQNFKASIDKELDEMRRCKAEMQQLKKEIINEFSQGYYKRDNQRIVLSAPEIIIGNVLRDGTLIPNESSTVTIRANTIRQEGVGTAYGFGRIINKATQIKNICVDVGLDGCEAVADADSRFTVQAQGIALRSESTEGTFVEAPSAGKGEISLKADNHVTLAALTPLAYRKTQIANQIERQQQKKKDYEDEAKSLLSQIKDCTKELSGYYGDSDDLFGSQDNSQTDDFKASAKLVDLEGLHDVIQSSQTTLNKLIKDFQRSTSKAAEASRKIKSLTADKTAIEEAEGNVEKSESTNATIDILAEHTNIQSVNSNYEICKSEGAGVGIWAKNVGINAIDAKEGIMSNSNFLVNTQHILLTTANKKLNGDTLDIPAEGDVKITSRNITLASVDKEYKTGDSSTGVTEKQLAKGGKIQLRAKNVSVDSQTTEGEAEGEFSVNSKLVKMGAVTATNATVAKDSLIDLNYEGARIASTEWLCLHSDKNTLVSAKENLEIQQDQDKAALQLTKGKTTLKGQDTNIMGTTTVTGKTTFKADAQLATATVKGLTVSSGIKTPSSNEGSVGTPAQAGSDNLNLLVKLSELEEKIKGINQKAEENKKQEEEAIKKQEK